MKDELYDFQLGRRSKKVKTGDEKKAYASAYKNIKHFARNTSRSGSFSGGGGAKKAVAKPVPKHGQRCAVRVSYAANLNNGQWGAHGTYIQRDSAQELDQPQHERAPDERDDISDWGYSALSESDFGEVARRQGPRSLNDMRRLSGIPMVSNGHRPEQLLSSYAFADMGGRTANQDGGVRRRTPGANATAQALSEKLHEGPGRGTGRRLRATDGRRVSPAGRLKTGVFGSAGVDLDARPILNAWQKAGDARLWKFIVSPEFGHELNHEQQVKDVIAGMERDLGTRLEWVAATHWNTDYPHTHVALRGVRDDGAELVLPRDYIKSAIRGHAEAATTRQLGYRTTADVILAAEREVSVQRVTSLDRAIAGAAKPAGADLVLDTKALRQTTRPQTIKRLQVLATAGLAYRRPAGDWVIRSNFQDVLKAAGLAADRQRTVQQHRALLSDDRLPVQFTDFRNLRSLEGRVLGHGQEEQTGKSYALIEGTDGKVHYLYHNTDIMKARAERQMQPGSYVELRKVFDQAGDRLKPRIRVQDRGDADKLLQDRGYLRHALAQRRGASSTAAYGGWLGRREAAIATFARQQPRTTLTNRKGRGRG